MICTDLKEIVMSVWMTSTSHDLQELIVQKKIGDGHGWLYFICCAVLFTVARRRRQDRPRLLPDSGHPLRWDAKDALLKVPSQAA